MRELTDGIIHWTVRHPNIGVEVGCHFVSGSGTVIDPLLPEAGVEWFDGRGLKRVVLSNRHHLRDAERLAERYGCPILCHESGLYQFEDGPAVEGFAFGDRVAADVVALEMGTICPDDCVLRIEHGGGALLFADSVIDYGGVGFVPDELIGDDPEGVKEETRRRCEELLGEQFEHLLFAHGDPIVGDGHEALRRFVED